jgi:hypothetical protein
MQVGPDISLTSSIKSDVELYTGEQWPQQNQQPLPPVNLDASSNQLEFSTENSAFIPQHQDEYGH